MQAEAGHQGADAGDQALLSEWMTLDELARELGVHKETIRNWNRQRRGPPFARIGLRRLYRRDAVKAWLRDQEEHDVPGGRR